MRWEIGHLGRRARPIDRSTSVDLRAISTDAVSRQQLHEARREGLAALTLARSRRRGGRDRSLAEPVVGVGAADCDVVGGGEGVAGRLRRGVVRVCCRGIPYVGCRGGGGIVDLCCDVVLIACYPIFQIAGHVECEPARWSEAGRYVVTVDGVGLVGGR